jgi:hypothetical protein
MALPVVKQGEELNAWLQRAVPTLVEQHQMNTQAASRLAKQAWDQINGGQDMISQMTGADQPTFQNQDSWGDNVVQSEEWPAPTDGEDPNAAWPDPFSQDDWDQLMQDEGKDPTAAASTDPQAAASVDPQAAQAPNPMAPNPMVPPAMQPPSVADGVAALLDTLKQITALIEGLQGITKLVGGIAQAAPQQPKDGEDAPADGVLPKDREKPADGEDNPTGEKPATDTPEGAQTDKPDPFGGNQQEAKKPTPAEGQPPASGEQPTEEDPKKKKPNPFAKSFLALGDVPTEGYAIPVAAERTRELPAELVSTKAVADFIAQNADLWKEGTYLGGKVDDATGKVSFGVFRHVPDAHKAAQTCAQLGVDSYFSLQTGEQIAIPVTQGNTWLKSTGFAGPNFIKKLGDYRDPGSLAAKALDGDRFGGYLCLWGDESTKDLGGEFFTPKTAELTAVFDALGHIPAIYHHAGDDTIKSAVIGLIDTMEQDESGMWVEAQAQLAAAYKQYIKPLIDQSALGWSSGALPRARKVAKSGEIVRWPIIEGSLTPTPFEWRMAVDWPVERIAKAYELAGLSTDILTQTKGKSR